MVIIGVELVMVKDNIFQDNIFHCLSAIFLCFILIFGSNSYPLENCLGGVSAAPNILLFLIHY